MSANHKETVVRLVLPDDISEAEVYEVLQKALKSPLSPEEKAEAEYDAAEARARLTGIFERMLPTHEKLIRYYDQDIKRSRGKHKQALIAERQHEINKAEWLARTHFSTYYEMQFLNGRRLAGNDKRLSSNEREIVRRLANNEAQFAIRALLDAQTGDYTNPLEWRGKLYGNAIDEAKWLGWLYGDLSSGRYVEWVLGTDGEGGTSNHGYGKHGEHVIEHCADCLWLAGRLDILESRIYDAVAVRQAKDPSAGLTPTESLLLAKIAEKKPTQGGRWGTGVYRAQELAKMGVVPQSGELVCTTNCKCHLEDAERPPGKTKQPEAKGWESIFPKTPTMLLRETEPERNEQLARLAEKWEHEHLPRRGHEVLKP